jgi:hypothetical protein
LTPCSFTCSSSAARSSRNADTCWSFSDSGVGRVEE